MGFFAFSVGLNLDRDWTALSFFGVLLVVLYFLFTIFAGLRSASDRMNNMLWPAILGVLAVIGVVLLSQFRESGDNTVRLSVETERLSVETGREVPESDSGQGAAQEDSFSHSGFYQHEHGDYGLHSHPD